MSQLNSQQQAAIDFCLKGKGHLNLIARAGTGKTTTLIEIAKSVPGKVFMGAFNRAIADELKQRIAGRSNVTANTLHGAGLGAWRRCFSRNVEVVVDGDKIRNMVRDSKIGWAKDNKVATAAQMLISYAKQAGLGISAPYEDVDKWEDIIDHYDVDDDLPATMRRKTFLENCIDTYEKSLAWCTGKGTPDGKPLLDFDDMLLAPLYHRAQLPQYNWVLIDECLIGDTPVLMESGRVQAISSIVTTETAERVMSYDPATKTTIPKRITGYHKIPLSKKLLRVTARRVIRNHHGRVCSAMTSYAKFGHRIVVCTEDHLFFSGGTWVEAHNLRPTSSLIWESHSPRDAHYQDKYKHSPAGRAKLAKEMTKKNASENYRSNMHCGMVETRGGNGAGPTDYEEALQQRLGTPWVCNYAVGLKGAGSGYPKNYKLDIANPVDKIGIELDGKSHRSKARQQQDKKKDAMLRSLGWDIVRMTNEESVQMTADLLHVVFGNSPVEAEVVSVDEFTPQEPYVYDIDVEDTHSFYANGIVVHNCQDTNETRRRLSIGMAKAFGRVIAVGDDRQACYGFAGATNDAMEIIKCELKSTELPLNVTYRCPKAVVKLAQQWVPDFTAHESAPEGVVRRIHHSQFWHEKFNPYQDVILCRYTRPLAGIATTLREGIPCIVEGQSVKALVALANKWGDIPIFAFSPLLDEYEEKKCKEWTMVKDRPDKAAAVHDRCGTIREFARRMNPDATTADLVQQLQMVFSEQQSKSGVLRLCTVHRAKGREWDRVYLVGRNEYMPSKWANQQWALDQEDNIIYVAITRSKRELVEVIVPETSPNQPRPDRDWWDLSGDAPRHDDWLDTSDETREGREDGDRIYKD